MNIGTIGANIKRARLSKNLCQQELAEKAGLSTNYIGMVERGERVPSLECFIVIANALDTSADILLADVLNMGYTVKNSILDDKMAALSAKERAKIYAVIEALLKHSGEE